MISPQSFQVGVYHHSFSPGGSEEQRQRKHLTKVTAKFRMESEHSVLCAVTSVLVWIRKKKTAPSYYGIEPNWYTAYP